jgi:hypothetical protein
VIAASTSDSVMGNLILWIGVVAQPAAICRGWQSQIPATDRSFLEPGVTSKTLSAFLLIDE